MVVHWGPGLELATLADKSKTYWSYHDMSSHAGFIAALDNLESYVLAEGPFDGVMAYSQGAGLAAMLLVRRQHLYPLEPPLFKCAIFFSPLQVYDPAAYAERGEVKVLGQGQEQEHEGGGTAAAAVSIPTAIIYGVSDERKDECVGLQAICDATRLSVFVHEGGHQVPGLGAKDGLLGSVRMARRAITLAKVAAC